LQGHLDVTKKLEFQELCGTCAIAAAADDDDDVLIHGIICQPVLDS
jgi:hypothetical protein